MKEKVKCKKCGLFIDSDCETCPYCGYPQHEEENEESKKRDESSIIPEKIDVITQPEYVFNDGSKNVEKADKIHFFDFESRVMNVKLSKSIILFVVGFFVLNLLLLSNNI